MNLLDIEYLALLKRVLDIVTIVRISLVMSLLLLNHLGVISKIQVTKMLVISMETCLKVL